MLVATGIVTAELARMPGGGSTLVAPCRACSHIEVDPDAEYCKPCGTHLHDPSPYTDGRH